MKLFLELVRKLEELPGGIHVGKIEEELCYGRFFCLTWLCVQGFQLSSNSSHSNASQAQYLTLKEACHHIKLNSLHSLLLIEHLTPLRLVQADLEICVLRLISRNKIMRTSYSWQVTINSDILHGEIMLSDSADLRIGLCRVKRIAILERESIGMVYKYLLQSAYSTSRTDLGMRPKEERKIKC